MPSEKRDDKRPDMPDTSNLPPSEFYFWHAKLGSVRMGKEQFVAARQHLGLTVEELAGIINYPVKAVEKWEDPKEQFSSGAPVLAQPGAMKFLALMLNGYRPPDWPERLNDKK